MHSILFSAHNQLSVSIIESSSHAGVLISSMKGVAWVANSKRAGCHRCARLITPCTGVKGLWAWAPMRKDCDTEQQI